MHILFDLDGTLTDPQEGIIKCIRFALSTLNIDIGEDIRLEAYIGPPLKDTFIDLCGNEDIALKAISAYRERFSVTGLFENKLYEGIPECLERLADKSHSMLVATAKPTIYSERIVEHFNLGQYFDNVFGSNLDGSLSDKTELLEHILERRGLHPKDTIMIGDRCFDMTAAKNTGIRALGVLWGYGTEDELTTAGADDLCNHPSEIYEKIYA